MSIGHAESLNSLPQLLLVDLMFLNSGAIFLMHLPTHTSIQSKKNSEVDNVDFAARSWNYYSDKLYERIVI